MKFKDLTIGKTYKIDANETKGELQEGEYGIGFRIREKHEYKENPDGLVRFYLSSDIENNPPTHQPRPSHPSSKIYTKDAKKCTKTCILPSLPHMYNRNNFLKYGTPG
jgi:hypothetical protein